MKTVTAGKRHNIKVTESTNAAWMKMRGKQTKAGYTGAPKKSWWPMTQNGLVSPLCIL